MKRHNKAALTNPLPLLGSKPEGEEKHLPDSEGRSQ